MATTELFYLSGILLPTSSWISELTDTTPAVNVEQITGYAAGGVSPDFVGAYGSIPDITFTTPQVATVLALCGSGWYDLSAGNTDLYYQASTRLGAREAIADLDHLQIRAVRALLTWDRITARQNQDAEISCRIIPTYDGTNLPLVPTKEQAIPSCAQATERFTLGPAAINTTTITGLQGWSLENRPQLDVIADSGEPYASYAGIQRFEPAFSFDTFDLEWWNTIGIAGLTLSSLTAYLRRLSPDTDTPYANNQSQHISITATNGIAEIERSSGAGSPASLSMKARIRRANCSAVYPMSISTASQIT